MTGIHLPSFVRDSARISQIGAILPALLFILGAACLPGRTGTTEQKLNSIVFPEFRMQNATLGEAVLYAKMRSQDLDPEHAGVNLSIDPAADSSRHITVLLVNAPLLQIVKCLEATGGMKAQISESGVVFAPAAPSIAAVVTPDAMPVPASPQKKAPPDYASSMVIIEGDQGMGSGFVARFNHAPVLFTNVHVLAANSQFTARTLGGKAIPLNSIFLADAPGETEKSDVAVMAQGTVTGGLEILDNVDANVNIGDDIVVPGNSLGAGVVTEIPGKVVGIGPDFIEVDAKFVAGNSGSPVIHLATGKVIGIATFATMRKMEGFGKDSQFNNTERRFAVRIDNMPSWRAITWQQLALESANLRTISKHTTELLDVARDISENGHVTYRKHESPDNSLSGIVSDFQQKMEAPGNNDESRRDAEHNLLFWLHHATEKDFSSLNYSRFSSYAKKELESQAGQRSALQKFWDYLDRRL